MSGAMHSQAMHFHARAGEKLRNPVLQGALRKARPLFVGKRVKGMQSLADDGLNFAEMRDAAAEIRQRVLDNLDVWLEKFEHNALARGAEVEDRLGLRRRPARIR